MKLKVRDVEFEMDLDSRRSYVAAFILKCFEMDGCYDPNECHFLCDILQPGDVFVDVGANIGYFTLLGAKLVGPAGRVLAFEPEFVNYQELKRHLELNGLNNVLTHNCACGPACGEAELFVNSDNNGGNAIWDVALHGLNPISKAHPIKRLTPLVAVDDCVLHLAVGRTKAIKIDVEGYEMEVLRGCESLMRGPEPPYIIAEVNRFGLQQMGHSETEFRNYMYNWGYDYNVITEGGKINLIDADTEIKVDGAFNALFTHREYHGRL